MHRRVLPNGTPKAEVSVKGGAVDGLDLRSVRKWIFTRSAVVPIPDTVQHWPGEPDE